jgi:hypothetical protein
VSNATTTTTTKNTMNTTMNAIAPVNKWVTQFYFFGDVDPIEGRAYFAGSYQERSGFYVVSYPLNKKTGRAWQASRMEVEDCRDKEEAIDFIRRLTGNY